MGAIPFAYLTQFIRTKPIGTYVLWFNFIFGLNFISICFGVW